MILLWLLACGDPATDSGAYLDALRALPDDPVAAAGRCGAVGGAAGDECLAFAAAATAAAGDPDRALALCSGASSPVWKDECGFLVAEETADAQGFEAGAKRCAGSGRFVDACLMHVWKSHATRLVASSGPAAAATAYAPALAWADDVIPWEAATAERFWDLFFDACFGSTTRTGPDPGALETVATPAALDLTLCDALPDLPAGDVTLPVRCRASLPQSLMRALNRADHRPSDVPGSLDVAALCAAEGTVAERIHRASDVRYVPSADLDAVAERFVARRCAQEPR